MTGIIAASATPWLSNSAQRAGAALQTLAELGYAKAAVEDLRKAGAI